MGGNTSRPDCEWLSLRVRDQERGDVVSALLHLVRSEHLAITLAFRKGRSSGTGAGSGEAAVRTGSPSGVVGQEAHTREFEERLGIGGGPSRITPRTWSTDTGFHGNATRPQVAPAAA
jgi:hypothetical protein